MEINKHYVTVFLVSHPVVKSHRCIYHGIRFGDASVALSECFGIDIALAALIAREETLLNPRRTLAIYPIRKHV